MLLIDPHTHVMFPSLIDIHTHTHVGCLLIHIHMSCCHRLYISTHTHTHTCMLLIEPHTHAMLPSLSDTHTHMQVAYWSTYTCHVAITSAYPHMLIDPHTQVRLQSLFTNQHTHANCHHLTYQNIHVGCSWYTYTCQLPSLLHMQIAILLYTHIHTHTGGSDAQTHGCQIHRGIQRAEISILHRHMDSWTANDGRGTNCLWIP
jgi:hypothetical protein